MSDVIMGSVPESNEITGTLASEETIEGNLATVYGKDGKSAYEIAVDNGFEGTEAEWLESLKGEKGDTGDKGDTGKSGVYLGSGDMPDDCNVQIDPSGEVFEITHETGNSTTKVMSQKGVTDAIEAISGQGGTDTEHTNNYNNPHNVTASQVGAYTKSETDSAISKATSGGSVAFVDLEYNPISANAQSGTAVAEAIATLTYEELSTNRLDESAVTHGMFLTVDGKEYTTGSYANNHVTDYIPVTEGENITFQAVTTGQQTRKIFPMRVVTAYDANRNVISSAGSSSATSLYVVPNNVCFVRATITNELWGYREKAIVNSTEVIPYEVYKKRIMLKNEYLDEEYIASLKNGENEADDTYYNYKYSTNSLDEDSVTHGMFLTVAGQELTDASYSTSHVTDYIPVAVGESITYQALPSGSAIRSISPMRCLTAYDANRNAISSAGVSGGTSLYVVPDNVCFIRATFTDAIWKYTKKAIVKSKDVIPYEAYEKRLVLKNEYLDEDYIASLKSAYSKKLALPTKIYGFVNQPIRLYFRNIMDYKPENVYIDMENVKGKLYADRWEYTPTATENHYIRIMIKDQEYNVLNDEYYTLDVKNSTSKTSLSVLVLGDSTVNAGVETQTMLDLASADNFGLTLLGTRGQTGSANQHEGRGGWTADGYVHNATGANNVVNAFYNPDTSAFDFSYYMTTQGYANVDCVFIQLGINDMFAAKTDEALTTAIETYLANMRTIINSIHTYNSSIKIVLNMIIPCEADQDKFTQNYSMSQTVWQCKKNTYEANLKLLSEFKGITNVYLSHYNSAVDVVNNMQGDVHPTDEGYAQLGTQMYGFMRAIN